MDGERYGFEIICMDVKNWCVTYFPLKYKVRKGIMAKIIYHAKVQIKEGTIGWKPASQKSRNYNTISSYGHL